MHIASPVVIAVVACLAAFAPAQTCMYDGIEKNDHQYPHRFLEPGGAGFIADFHGSQDAYGIRVRRFLANGDTAWKRTYLTGYNSFHYGANRAGSGPIRVWFTGPEGGHAPWGLVRVLAVDAASGDSLDVDTLFTHKEYLRASIIPTQDGGAAACVISFSSPRTLLVFRTDGTGRTLWKADLVEAVFAIAGREAFMVTGGAETEDGGILVAVSTQVSPTTAGDFLLFKLDTSGRAEIVGQTAEIPCAIAHNTKRMHYGGRRSVEVSFNLKGVGGAAPIYTTKVWIDTESATGIAGRINRDGNQSMGRTGTSVSGFGKGSYLYRWSEDGAEAGANGFTADGCRVGP